MMRKTILTVGIALSLLGAAGAEELAVTAGQRTYLDRDTMLGPTSQGLKGDLEARGLVGSARQRPIELEAFSASPQLVSDDFVIRPRPQRLEEFLRDLPDRSRPHILQPNNSTPLLQVGF